MKRLKTWVRDGLIEGASRTYSGLASNHEHPVPLCGPAHRYGIFLCLLVFGSDVDTFALQVPTVVHDTRFEHRIALGGYDVREEKVVYGVESSNNMLCRVPTPFTPESRPEFYPITPPGKIVIRRVSFDEKRSTGEKTAGGVWWIPCRSAWPVVIGSNV
jgi:hypothetical protein